MAFNNVILAGVVIAEPEFINDGAHNGETRDALEVTIQINRIENQLVDTVSFLICNQKLISRALREIRVGDYLIMNRGRILTQHYQRQLAALCPHCQTTEYFTQKGEITDVECLDFSVIAGASPDLPGVNQVYLLGNICTDIALREGEQTFMKYKLAVNRGNSRYGNGEKSEQHADYPFVLSYHPTCVAVARNIKVGALVLIRGSIKQRYIAQTMERVCSNPECNEFWTVEAYNPVREIVAADMTFLTTGDKGQFPMLPEYRECLLENPTFTLAELILPDAPHPNVP